jgi:hypothetical protein
VDVKFKVGDIICTKTQGPPACGEIAAVYSENYYNWNQDQEGTKQYTNEPRYVIFFSEPIKVITVQEVMDEFNWPYAEAESYVNNLKSHNYLEYPESCIELLHT